MGMNDVHSLSHSKRNCKYHIVFAPKYRRKVFYQGKKAAIGKILRQLCEERCKNTGSCSVSRAYLPIRRNPAKAVSARNCGVSEGEERSNDV